MDDFTENREKEFDGFFSCALNTWALKQAQKNPDYPKYQEKLSVLENQIELLLGENKSLVQEFKETKALLDSCLDIPNYLQGWRDCLLLLRRLELL